MAYLPTHFLQERMHLLYIYIEFTHKRPVEGKNQPFMDH